MATSVGDEGGFAPSLETDEEAIEWIIQAVCDAGSVSYTHLDVYKRQGMKQAARCTDLSEFVSSQFPKVILCACLNLSLIHI